MPGRNPPLCYCTLTLIAMQVFIQVHQNRKKAYEEPGYVWSSHTAKVRINRVRLPILLVVSWTGKKTNISLSPFAPENLVSRDRFGSPVPRQAAHLRTPAESGAHLRDSSRLPDTRLYAIKRFCLRSLLSHLNVLTYFPPDWGMLRTSRRVQIFLKTQLCYTWYAVCGLTDWRNAYRAVRAVH